MTLHKVQKESRSCACNYGELRKRAPPTAASAGCDYAFVAGLPDPPDAGQEGFFEWRSDSAAADDGGIVFKPNSSPIRSKGRWHRVFDGAVSVRWFGAQGNGFTDDTDAIQSAIAAAIAGRRAAVHLPPGRYRLTRAIEITADFLSFSGTPGSVLLVDPSLPLPGESYRPEAILVNKGFPPAEVKGTVIRDFRIEVIGGSDLDSFSAGVIQLNNCSGCLVRDIQITYTGPVPKPKNIDGIVTSQGTSGLIQNCTVDGIPKAGIYIAQGSHDVRVDQCETKNTAGPIGQAGIAVTGANRIAIRNCLSHDNGGPGLLIAVNGPIAGNAPVAATNVQVLGGSYYGNGEEGVRIASAWEFLPRNIQVLNVTTESNRGRGIGIEAGSDVVIGNPVSFGNGVQGIWIENLPADPGNPRTTRIDIVNPVVYDNCSLIDVDGSGIGLRAVDRVTITGGRLAKSPGNLNSHQEYGVALYLGAAMNPCTNLRMLDTYASMGQKKPLAALDLTTGFEDPQAAAVSGYYRIQSSGDPEAAIPAPPGSEYVDLTTGFAYRKTSGIGTAGWTELG